MGELISNIFSAMLFWYWMLELCVFSNAMACIAEFRLPGQFNLFFLFLSFSLSLRMAQELLVRLLFHLHKTITVLFWHHTFGNRYYFVLVFSPSSFSCFLLVQFSDASQLCMVCVIWFTKGVLILCPLKLLYKTRMLLDCDWQFEFVTVHHPYQIKIYSAYILDLSLPSF